MQQFDWAEYIRKTSTIDLAALQAQGVQYPQMVLNLIAEHIKPEAVRSTLEIGCSAGYWGVLIERALGKRLYKVGIDLQPEALEYTIIDRYISADILDYSSDDEYDVVFSLGLLEHFPPHQRRQVLEKHLQFSRRYVIVGMPNTALSLRYLTLRILQDMMKGNKHYAIPRNELTRFVEERKVTQLYAGYLGNNSFLQRTLRLQRQLGWVFLKDYFLLIIQKNGGSTETALSGEHPSS